jgi:3-hydroxyisobutyrate dehydrogenase
MGRVLATHILDAGHDLTVWNRSPSNAAELVAAGAKFAATAKDAVVGADLVVTALFGPAAVREVVIGGELPVGPETVWVDITTVSPDDADAFAAWARGAGVRYVHSPVIGSLAPAANRSLGVLVGGDPEDRDKALPIVSLWADPSRLWQFDAPTKAAGGKLVANLALAVSMQGLVEGLDLGHASGLSTDEVLMTLTGTGLGMIAGMKGQTIRSRSFDATQFSTDLLVKDIGLMLDAVDRPLPGLVAAYATLIAAQDAGHGDDDFSVIAARTAAF